MYAWLTSHFSINPVISTTTSFHTNYIFIYAADFTIEGVMRRCAETPGRILLHAEEFR
jgi:ABC-type uncharacterized transport system permease subunit